MAPDGIVEAVDVASNGLRCLVASVENVSPKKLCLDGLEERGIIVAEP
jgi:hypothetical protein